MGHQGPVYKVPILDMPLQMVIKRTLYQNWNWFCGFKCSWLRYIILILIGLKTNHSVLLWLFFCLLTFSFFIWWPWMTFYLIYLWKAQSVMDWWMKILLINFCVFFRVADFIFWSMLLVSVKTSGTVFKLNISMFELPPYKTLSFFTSPFCDS